MCTCHRTANIRAQHFCVLVDGLAYACASALPLPLSARTLRHRVYSDLGRRWKDSKSARERAKASFLIFLTFGSNETKQRYPGLTFRKLSFTISNRTKQLTSWQNSYFKNGPRIWICIRSSELALIVTRSCWQAKSHSVSAYCTCSHSERGLCLCVRVCCFESRVLIQNW